MTDNPALYGITNSNRIGNALWGKNQFNSTFPVSLACYMRDKDIKAVYLKINDELKVVDEDINIGSVFNTTEPNNVLNFLFESKYQPFQQYAYDDIGHIDLVIKCQEEWLRALEVKLTVLPDETTHSLNEEDWSSELVVRPVTTRYAALSISESLHESFGEVRELIEPACHSIGDWSNRHEILANRVRLLNALNTFQSNFFEKQRPFLLQPIWKTTGKKPVLEENAFDIFVWSDFALCRTFLDRSMAEPTINRFLRSSARLARILFDISTRGKANINQIYTEMAFGLQTDKEFSLSGRVTKEYLPSQRRKTPVLKHEILTEVILGGGQKKLSPERRFDQTIYFTTQRLFDNNQGVND